MNLHVCSFGSKIASKAFRLVKSKRCAAKVHLALIPELIPENAMLQPCSKMLAKKNCIDHVKHPLHPTKR